MTHFDILLAHVTGNETQYSNLRIKMLKDHFSSELSSVGFKLAIYYNQIKFIDYLLKNDYFYISYDHIEIAASYNHIEILDLFFKYKPNFLIDIILTGNSYFDLVLNKYLKEKHNITKEMDTLDDKPIYKACISGDIETIKKLIEEGLDINNKIQNHNCQPHVVMDTIITIAAENNQLELVKFLMKKGGIINKNSLMVSLTCDCNIEMINFITQDDNDILKYIGNTDESILLNFIDEYNKIPHPDVKVAN